MFSLKALVAAIFGTKYIDFACWIYITELTIKIQWSATCLIVRWLVCLSVTMWSQYIVNRSSIPYVTCEKWFDFLKGKRARNLVIGQLQRTRHENIISHGQSSLSAISIHGIGVVTSIRWKLSLFSPFEHPMSYSN